MVEDMLSKKQHKSNLQANIESSQNLIRSRKMSLHLLGIKKCWKEYNKYYLLADFTLKKIATYTQAPTNTIFTNMNSV
jgi:hypothetical protein